MDETEIEALIKAALDQFKGEVISREEFGRSAAFIRGLGDKLEKVPSIDTFVQMGLFEKADDGSVKLKIQSTPAPGKKQDAEPEWKVELTRMQEQLAAKDRQIEAERKQREATETKSAIIAALEKAGAVNPSRDYVHVLDQVKRGEDGKFYVPKANEYGAEDKIELETAFTSFLASNPELRKAQGRPGSGTPTHGVTAPGAVDISTMDMASYMANRDKIKSGQMKV